MHSPELAHLFHLLAQEVSWSYARSSGKGGQNINKVNSKAILYWNVLQTQLLAESIKMRFVKKYQTKISLEGILQIQSEQHRDQPKNKSDCFFKLQQMIHSVIEEPKKRQATKPTWSSKLKRLKGKNKHAEKKSNRKKTQWP